MIRTSKNPKEAQLLEMDYLTHSKNFVEFLEGRFETLKFNNISETKQKLKYRILKTNMQRRKKKIKINVKPIGWQMIKEYEKDFF